MDSRFLSSPRIPEMIILNQPVIASGPLYPVPYHNWPVMQPNVRYPPSSEWYTTGSNGLGSTEPSSSTALTASSSAPAPVLIMTPPLSSDDSVEVRNTLGIHQSNYSNDVSNVLEHNPRFQNYLRRNMTAIVERNGGEWVPSNPRMRRLQNEEIADDAYREQRAKNNLAAKRSRNKRREKETMTLLKLNFLRTSIAEMKALLASNVCNSCVP